MFSSQGNDELLADEDQTYQDLMVWQQDGHTHTHVEPGGGNINPSTNDAAVKSRRSAKKPPISSASGNIHDAGDNSKKILHREIERQRRQEMAALYASLRTLLPLECIKGKRSVSDHMDGAVSYIKQLENRMSDLRATRDELKRLSSRSGSIPTVNATNIESSSTAMTSPTCSVTVHPSSGGIEILCNSGFRDDGLMTLSRMLQVIHDEGLAVISCVSTQVDQRFLHTINTEVCDPTCLDLLGLQQKLIMALAP